MVGAIQYRKSFISLFMITPVSGSISCVPKRILAVVVRSIAMLSPSVVSIWAVPLG